MLNPFKDKEKNIQKMLKRSLVVKLSELFSKAGKQLYLVGGSVRDAILNLPHEDLDFTTDARPEEIQKIVKDYAEEIWKVGARFGTVGIIKKGQKAEITTFRFEIYARDSRHPTVTFSKKIEDDLVRRDFTINAIAVELPSGRLIDPYGGFRDLAKGLIKTPAKAEKSFSDDPLRMLRAARFVAMLGFKIDPNVKKAVVNLKNRLKIISKERIRDELSRLLSSKYPVDGLRLIVDTGIADYIIPEVPKLKMEIEPEYYHKDVLEHTYRVVASMPADLILRLAALLHDIGKPDTRIITKGEIHFYGHDILGARMARKRLFELRYPKAVIDEVVKLIKLHLRPYTYYMGWTDKAVRRYVRDAGPLLYKVNTLAIADCTTRIPEKAKRNLELIRELERRIKKLEEEEESAKIRPPIDGHEAMEHLKIKPGPFVGEAMDMLLEARLDGKIKTKKEAFSLLDKWAKQREIKK